MTRPDHDATPTGPPIVITPMRRRHLRAVLAIEERTSTTPWSLGLFLAEARRQERVYLVARSGHRVVGKMPSTLPFSSRTHPASTMRSASSSRRFSVSFSIAASGFSGLDVPMSWTCR